MIVVLGAGPIGLATAMMVSDRGHDVIVLERDEQPAPGSPDEAWTAWDRGGVAQFRQPHYLHAAGRVVLDERLPEVKEALLAAGGITINMLGSLPPMIGDRERRPGDERFVTVTARRPVIEYAFANAVDKKIEVRRGVAVTGLTSRGAQVTGVRLANGEEFAADLVVDAMGRRSVLPDWLEAIGARRPFEEEEDCGFAYYTRYFRAVDGNVPSAITGALTPLGSFSLLTLYGDARTWSATVFISSRDKAMKPVVDTDKWTALVAACPLHKQFLDGEPVTDVLPMARIVDRYRRFVVDGEPVATGVIAVGDAWACTNPSLGRGITIGLKHAAATADVIDEHLGDPDSLARAHDAATEEHVTPWYRDSLEIDRARLAEMDAEIDGRPARAPDPMRASIEQAMLWDADVFRGFLDTVTLHALPHQVYARLGDRITAVAAEREPFTMPGPSRAEILQILS